MGDGLPGSRLVRGAMVAVTVAFVAGIYLLLAPPTLPHEQGRSGGAPPVTNNQNGSRPAGTAPAGTPLPATPVSTTPAPTSTPQPARRHTIRSGDTLLAIAEQYDTTVDAIRAANPGLSETALQVGQEIVIPPSR